MENVKENNQNDMIPRRLAAIEVLKWAKMVYIITIFGIGGMFITSFASSSLRQLGYFLVIIFTGFFIYYLTKSVKMIKYLTKKYDFNEEGILCFIKNINNKRFN